MLDDVRADFAGGDPHVHAHGMRHVRISRPGPLESRLDFAEGTRTGRSFEHPCLRSIHQMRCPAHQ